MFTPGPWRIGKHGSVVTDHRVGPATDDVTKDYGGYVICETVTPSNAALIVAAPYMYELLRRIVQDPELYWDLDAQRILTMADGIPCAPPTHII